MSQLPDPEFDMMEKVMLAEKQVREIGEKLIEIKRLATEAMGEKERYHYGHIDPMGTQGANCPACHADRRVNEALKKIVEVANV